jgi:hypothetical protein
MLRDFGATQEPIATIFALVFLIYIDFVRVIVGCVYAKPMPCELVFKLESFVTPDVAALVRSNIRMSPLVLCQGTVHFAHEFAFLARVHVNVVAYEVTDAPMFIIDMISKR